MMTGLGKAASKAFGPSALKIPWIDFGKTRGLKPRIAGMDWVPLWTTLEDDSTILGSDKIKGAKPSMTSMAHTFFGAGTPESTGDSTFSLIKTEVGRAGILILEGTLQRHSCKYSFQSSLDPIDIVV